MALPVYLAPRVCDLFHFHASTVICRENSPAARGAKVDSKKVFSSHSNGLNVYTAKLFKPLFH